MGRWEQGKKEDGSQKWLQDLVNDCRDVINQRLAEWKCLEQICWLSPLKEDCYSEYSDKHFICRLGGDVKLKAALKSFWPDTGSGGPHWDALAKTAHGEMILVEAKSRIGESPGPCGAGADSLKRINDRFEEVKRYLGVCSGTKWAMTKYYQYANRLAHLYFFREYNDNLPAYLVYIYFMNDHTVKDSPGSRSEWECAIDDMNSYLGIPEQHGLSRYILNAFIDIRELISQK